MDSSRARAMAGAVLLTGTALVLFLLLTMGAALPSSTVRESPINADGPPTGHTGGFGEPTCQTCHSDAELNPAGGVLGVDGVPTVYEPGTAYAITIVLVSEDMTLAGFQGAFRFAAGNSEGSSAGRLEPIDTRVTVRVAMPAGLEYIQHTPPGTALAEPELATWVFRWTAPDADDPVIFHVAANSANGDNSPFGDFIYTAEARSDGPEN